MPKISEAEKNRRHRINESVLGTNAMEGLYPDAETLALLQKYEDGELTGEQLSSALNEHALSLVEASRLAGAA
ncbi:antitoxin VbhA family protein [Granulicella mallensis]|jgi:hypothetical protein|uniref:Antitoxin VbhA domain-containing protein n=1 Tax=Granulicella mallensis TaxID=940614 RepID=A0A7W8EB99_9BACT|nr:antitoxin VbhA family protein [Granulicella mallensis]MBB5065359.1 hypothetical protein [Granulicella mallensis]